MTGSLLVVALIGACALTCAVGMESLKASDERAEIETMIKQYVSQKTKQCGENWQEKYVTFHKNEMLKETDKRILAAIPNLSGTNAAFPVTPPALFFSYK